MRRAWTSEELNDLKENIGVIKLTTIAKRINRSYDAVVMKLNRLGLSNTREQTGLVTLGELAKHLKVDRNIVKGWVDRHGLPCTKKKTRNTKTFYLVDILDFWKWAEENKEKVQFSNIEPNTLLPEPDWVEKERQKDYQMNKRRVYKGWTTVEDQLLLTLREKGLTYKEIGKRLNRSAISVGNRHKRIKQFMLQIQDS
ncbi:DNA-binding protein [Calidifontibacillus erzurumensis]|uniref:DNA-binding protein n=1 Tax=Calidifontibacillus erzurumensis TaxID=2741433 RepID=A0A8J8GHE5_9BACI|nr:DNA-binding protein [Calidifontibacillus erzurumensis]NSL51826.1 DNA-binding protein [Calidifontibacillus erzurumensis]